MPYTNYRGVPMPESAGAVATVSGTSAGGETLTAPAGPSLVDGNGGGDVLIGSNGDNIFNVKDLRDTVQVSGGLSGVKTVVAYNSFALPDNVQNLTVHNDFNYAVGNALDNLIVVDGSQWVYGAGGNDVLVGSTTQRTTFIERAGEGNDVIYNWQGNDQLQLQGYGFRTAGDIKAAISQIGGDSVLRLSASETLTFRGVTPAAFSDRQFLLPLDTSKLGALTFSDDFNSLQVFNPSTGAGIWRTDFGGNLKDQQAYTLIANGEQQVYVQPGFQGQGEQALGINPFAVSNGVLSITAAPTPSADVYAAYGHGYTSGMLNTLGMFEQKYGYFEVRAEMPTATGSWPAFWLLPHPYSPNIEADIFEALGSTPNLDYRRAYGAGDTQYDNIYKLDAPGFHTYGLLWTASNVTFFYDGTAVLSGATPATWTQPLGLILNLAVGGFGGNPAAAAYPASLHVDYVHVYALADGSTQTVHDTPELPIATLRDDGPASGQVNAPPSFDGGSQAVTTAHIALYPAQPTTLPAGRTMVIWEHSGAVFGAVSDGSTLAAPTTLMAGTLSQFTGSGTWLTDGKVVFGYLQANAAGGQDAWDMVFDPAKLSFVRQDLGPTTGGLSFVATANGGFAASWHAPDSTVQARGYDEHAYGGDVPGWYGPVRQIAGDLAGVTADGHLIATSAGGGQQLYDLSGAASPASPPPASGAGVNLVGRAGGDTVMGGAGDDTVTGVSGSNYLRGGDGADVINGGSGFDDINGNVGNDTAHGNAGDDWVVGGKDNDMLFGDAGGDIVWGNLGNDTLDGGDGNDQVRGGQGDDVLNGGPGDDYVSGDRGADTITGGAGADMFHTFSGAGMDRVLDFHEAEGDRVMLDPGTAYTVSQVGADTVIDMGGGDQMVLVNTQLSSLHAGWIFGA